MREQVISKGDTKAICWKVLCEWNLLVCSVSVLLYSDDMRSSKFPFTFFVNFLA